MPKPEKRRFRLGAVNGRYMIYNSDMPNVECEMVENPKAPHWLPEKPKVGTQIKEFVTDTCAWEVKRELFFKI